MVKPFVYIACLALFFFLFVPGAGAFYVRNQWRQFRKNLLQSTLCPFLEYSDVHIGNDEYIGTFRFIGALEALEEDIVWIRNDRLTISASMNKCQVYLLPSQATVEKEGFFENNIETLPDESPQRISWRNIFTLPEGTTVFISGMLFREEGRTVFKAMKEQPLLMVIFDGSKETILRRSIWGGRQKNEYWNQFTIPSLVVGFFSLLIYAYLLYSDGPLMRLPTVVALTVGLLPLVALFPPGIFGLFFFRNFWRKARMLRAERDLLLLPLRFFPNGTAADRSDRKPVLLPDGTIYFYKQMVTNLEEITRNCVRGLKVRTPSVISRPSRSDVQEYSLFGMPVPAGNELFYLPSEDPMVEYLLIPGDAETLSSRCALLARKSEYISVSTFILGLSTNLVLLFIILYALIK